MTATSTAAAAPVFSPATPPERMAPPRRDLALDALRAGALAVVVVGHWLLAVVAADDGQVRATSLLQVAPWTRWLTWALQVMPVFFVVGGAVSAASWRRAAARGETAGGWLRARAARLLHPTVPLLAGWALAAPLAVAAGVDPALARLGSQAALVPLWFLAVYLVVQALTPALLVAHERLGTARLVTATVAAVALVDAAHLHGVPLVGWANFVLVWTVPTLLGFAVGDGALSARGQQLALATGGLGALVALVTLAGYPVSMVGVDGAARSNNTPPSLALVALAFAQTGLLLAVRERLGRALGSPARRRVVAVMASTSMGLYLWHLTAMVLVIGVAVLAGVGAGPAPLTAGWWLTRPLWVGVLLLVTLPFVVASARHERRAPRPGAAWPSGRASLAVALGGTVLAAAGIGSLVVDGMVAPGRVLPPLPALAALLLGCALLGVFPRQPRLPTQPRGVAPQAALRGTQRHTPPVSGAK